MADIYLASRSPRRRELLHQVGVRFETLLLRAAHGRGLDVDETQQADENAQSYAERVATQKAIFGRMVLAARSRIFRPVLAADTVVVLDGEVLGKPENPLAAARFLRRLSGQTHEVRTVVALAASASPSAAPLLASSVSRVRLRHLDDGQIERYCASNEPLDKAGGYAIQGRAAVFIEHIEGSYSGVVGLPLFETAALLEQAGVRVL
jgi:septum formation protein